MNIKKHIEDHPIHYVLIMLFSGLSFGFAASTWFFVNKWNEERASLQRDMNAQVAFLQSEANKWENEYQKAIIPIADKLKITIHVLNTQRGGPIVARIQQSLTKTSGYRTIGILVLPGDLSGVRDYAKLRPDLLIAHRHSFQPRNDKLIIEALELYYQKNTKIKFLIFSESFLYNNGQSEFKNNLPVMLKDNVRLIGIDYRKDTSQSQLYPLRDTVQSMLTN